MAYEKQNFSDGQVLTAEQLNKIEDGLCSVYETLGDIDTALDNIISIQESLIGGESA